VLLVNCLQDETQKLAKLRAEQQNELSLLRQDSDTGKKRLMEK
jgi:hypothetical protein